MCIVLYIHTFAERYYGGGNVSVVNNGSQPLTSEFVSLGLKGRSDGFTIMGGDATAGTFATMYDGPRPFQPMPNATLNSDSVSDGANVMALQLEPCAQNAPNQMFRVFHELNSTSIAATISGVDVCLDIQGFKKKAGSNVYGWFVNICIYTPEYLYSAYICIYIFSMMECVCICMYICIFGFFIKKTLSRGHLVQLEDLVVTRCTALSSASSGVPCTHCHHWNARLELNAKDGSQLHLPSMLTCARSKCDVAVCSLQTNKQAVREERCQAERVLVHQRRHDCLAAAKYPVLLCCCRRWRQRYACGLLVFGRRVQHWVYGHDQRYDCAQSFREVHHRCWEAAVPASAAPRGRLPTDEKARRHHSCHGRGQFERCGRKFL